MNLTGITQEQVDAAVATVRDTLRERGNLPLAAVVNNAGVADVTPLEVVKESTMRWVYDVNVFGVFRVAFFERCFQRGIEKIFVQTSRGNRTKQDGVGHRAL